MTDLVTQYKIIYFFGNTPGTDCDADGDTGVGTNPSANFGALDFCPPVEVVVVECGACTEGSAGLVITELSYDPATAQGGDGDCEYIELFNSYSNPIVTDASTTVTLSTGVTFSLPAGTTIAPGEYIIVAINPTGFGTCNWATPPPAGVQIFGPTSGSLANGGEDLTITLACANDAMAGNTQTVTFNDGLTPGAGGGGNSVYYPLDGTGPLEAEPTPGSGDCAACAMTEYTCATSTDLTCFTDAGNFEPIACVIPAGENEWTYDGVNNCYQINTFTGTTGDNTEAYLILGSFDLSSSTDLDINFTGTEGFNGSNLDIVYNCAYTGDPTAGGWTTAGTIASGTPGPYTVDVSAATGAGATDCYIAILYTADGGPSGTSDWEICNITLTTSDATCPTGPTTPVTSECPVNEACPDITDGTLSATVGGVAASDICSGDVVTVCVDVDLTNDPTAVVEFSNDGGGSWSDGTPDVVVPPVQTISVNINGATNPYTVTPAGPYYVGDIVNYQASGTHPMEIIDPTSGTVVTGVTANGS